MKDKCYKEVYMESLITLVAFILLAVIVGAPAVIVGNILTEKLKDRKSRKEE